MRKRYVLVLVGAAILIGVLAFRPWASVEPATADNVNDAPTTQKKSAPPSRFEGDARPSAPKVTEKKRKVDEAERERYRRAIRDAIAQRDTGAKPSPPSAPDDRPPTDERDQSGEGLKDRSGGKLAGLMKDLQEDVMPLADECYEQALERDPTIAGGLIAPPLVLGQARVAPADGRRAGGDDQDGGDNSV